MKTLSLDDQKKLIEVIKPVISSTDHWLTDSYERVTGNSIKNTPLDHVIHRRYGKLKSHQLELFANSLAEYEGKGISEPSDDALKFLIYLNFEDNLVRQLRMSTRYLQRMSRKQSFNNHYYAFTDGYVAYGYLHFIGGSKKRFRFELREIDPLYPKSEEEGLIPFDLEVRRKKIRQLKKYCQKAGIDILSVSEKIVWGEHRPSNVDIYTGLEWEEQAWYKLGWL